MEINNLPVELMVVWNGHFNIDNPAQNKGVEGGPGRGWGGVEEAYSALMGRCHVSPTPTVAPSPWPEPTLHSLSTIPAAL